MQKLLIALLVLFAGCAADQQHGGPAKEIVRLGVIESVAPIKMDASSAAGSTAGGIFGQVGGANTGTGRGAVVGSVLGGVLGGTLGNEAGVATRPGLELWIRLDGDEQSTYVMQPGKPGAFRVGDRVRVVRKKSGMIVELDTQPVTKP
jgi:outer membrane lipoprotein SlyB